MNQFLDVCVSKICAFLVIVCFVVVENSVTLHEHIKEQNFEIRKITKNYDPDDDHKTI